jgi:hypothetical protein
MPRWLLLLLIPFLAFAIALRAGWECFSEMVLEVWREGR